MTSEHRMGEAPGETRRGGRDIVVIGASSGGVKALKELFAVCPPDLPASFFVVLHRKAHQLYPLENAHAALGLSAERLGVVSDGASISPRLVYLAPADMNMFVDRGRLRIDRGPRDFLRRPSINALFRSAAAAYGRRVVGVILTGALDDGSAGLWEIKRRGGVAIVQDPEEAEFKEMPEAALSQVEVDYCLPLADIGPQLAALAEPSLSPRPFDGCEAPAVLIVEDEGIVALSLERRLVELGYRVCASVRSGEDAVQAAARTHPDVVLMDIRLSGPMDGIEAARTIRDRFQVPVIYVTAYADDATLDRVKTTDAYGYIVKPYNPVEVHAAIQLALERRERELNAS